VASKNVSVGEAHKNWRCKYFDKAEKQKQNIEINIISFALRFFICTRVSFCGGKIILFAKFLFSCQPPKNPFRNSEIQKFVQSTVGALKLMLIMSLFARLPVTFA